jgi:hypothetical protein
MSSDSWPLVMAQWCDNCLMILRSRVRIPPGERNWKRKYSYLAIAGSVNWHYSQQRLVGGLKSSLILKVGSTLVEQSAHDPTFKCSNLATAGTRKGKYQKQFDTGS